MPSNALELLQGTLDVLVLRALAGKPQHGYAVARFIRDSSDGSLSVIDGALYTALHRMEERGWVESEWGLSEKGKRAKFYRLTAAGRRALRSEAANWQEYVAAVAKVLRAEPA
ncbi:MAG TPA: PadR family transcriptional regulator [Gemmatimonadaceae bacterium]|jgi:transcriptional regulator